MFYTFIHSFANFHQEARRKSVIAQEVLTPDLHSRCYQNMSADCILAWRKPIPSLTIRYQK